MKYEVGQKFEVKGKELQISIVSRRPGAQSVSIPTNGLDFYEIMINGLKLLIPEPMLELLIYVPEAPKPQPSRPTNDALASAKPKPVAKKEEKKIVKNKKKK